MAKPCDIYLIDEPSAYLDSEQRVIASKVMKRWIMSQKRAAFVVEHDFIMATYMADKVIVFDGIPAKESHCSEPETLVTGMNKFLKMMDITFRRDPTNYRPRINKMDSQKDQIQKAAGNYFLMEESKEEKERKRAKAALEKEEEESKETEEVKQEDKGKKPKGKKKKGDDDDWV